MARLTIELIGKKKVVGILSALTARVKNLKPAFKDVADNFREVEKLTFKAGGRPSHWKALSPVYERWKASHHPGKPIMILTGNLKDSLISTGGNHIEKIRRQSLTIGTKDPKGDWHQHGRGNLPVRKVISPKPSDITEWVGIIRSYIVEKLGLRRTN